MWGVKDSRQSMYVCQLTRPSKGLISASPVTLSQASSLIHNGAGFGGCFVRSRTMAPFKKNCHSSLVISPDSKRILDKICNNNPSSICTPHPQAYNFTITFSNSIYIRYVYVCNVCIYICCFGGVGGRILLEHEHYTDLKGQKKLVFLKQSTSCVFVNTIRMVLNQVLDPLFDIV